jgi:hypothetical protein
MGDRVADRAGAGSAGATLAVHSENSQRIFRTGLERKKCLFRILTARIEPTRWGEDTRTVEIEIPNWIYSRAHTGHCISFARTSQLIPLHRNDLAERLITQRLEKRLDVLEGRLIGQQVRYLRCLVVQADGPCQEAAC